MTQNLSINKGVFDFIGVGSSNIPAGRKLHVDGDINFNGNLYQNGVLFTGGDDAVWNTSGPVAGITTINYLDGNVGIGTDNPGTKLEVAGSATIVGDGEDLIVESDDHELVLIGNRGSSGVGLDKGYLRMKAEGTNTIALDTAGHTYFNGGNVGIGTTIPNRKLQIHSDTAASQTVAVTTLSGAAAISHASIGHGTDKIGNLQLSNASGNLKVRLDAGGDSYLVGGNVGIGTTSPDYPLDIIGTLRVSEAQTWLRSNSAAAAVLYVNQEGSAESAVFLGGNVGIGTASPGGKLEVLSSAVSDYALKVTRANGTRLAIMYQDGNSNGTIGAYNSSDTAKVWLNTAGDSYLNGGNVGIGITNPSHDLTLGSPTSTGTTAERLKIYRGADDIGQNLEMGYNHITVTRDANTLANPQSTFSIKQRGSDAERTAMHIDTAGFVGIGTSTTNDPLTIQHTADAGSTAEERTAEHSLLRLELLSSGTHAPYAGWGPALDFWGRNYDSTTIRPNARIVGSCSNASAFHTGGHLAFLTTPTDTATDESDFVERMRITAEGFVGIGTSLPDYTLHVASGNSGAFLGVNYASSLFGGTTNAETAIAYQDKVHIGSVNTAGNPLITMTLEKDGNVGIGTPDPSARLEVITASSVYAAKFKTSNDPLVQADMSIEMCWSNKAATQVTYGIVIKALAGTTAQGYLIGASYGGVERFKVKNNGEVFLNAILHASDDRLKHNEQVITGALDTLAKITPKKYIKTLEMYDADHDFELDADGNPVDEDGEPVEHHIEAGVIAQEVMSVDELAFAVTPGEVDENGDATSSHSLNYNTLFTYAISAIKELKQENDQLKSRIENLESN